MEKDLTWTEVDDVIWTRKGGKALPVAVVSVVIIQAVEIVGEPWLWQDMSVEWQERQTCEDWKKGIIMSIFKKGEKWVRII